jgi:hypothetical protein
MVKVGYGALEQAASRPSKCRSERHLPLDAAYPRSAADKRADRDVIRRPSADLALLARCLDVDTDLENWDTEADPISGRIAADALDQARGLLDELVGGAARAVADAVARIAAALPAPSE